MQRVAAMRIECELTGMAKQFSELSVTQALLNSRS
jgi:hypothetical protein